MIRKGLTSDIDMILEITRACTNLMISQGIFQWNDHYPNRKAFEIDVMRNELFVLETENKIVGCIAISTLMDEEYVSVNWITPNKNNIYIHRLAIHPDHQGKGFARKLMDFAEQFAIKNNFMSIRLDTFSQNKRNQLFYELRGYQKLEDVYFPNQSKFPFHCYELKL